MQKCIRPSAFYFLKTVFFTHPVSSLSIAPVTNANRTKIAITSELCTAIKNHVGME